jgi:DNA topoisomerase-1
MAIAQALYMGKEVGDDEIVGLITYMRTDSTNVSTGAQAEARTYIAGRYGEAYVPEQPPVYKTRAKGAQEAHEAIRPTSVLREPAALKAYLERDEYRLYDLIWKRFIASQMEPRCSTWFRSTWRPASVSCCAPARPCASPASWRCEEGHEEGDVLGAGGRTTRHGPADLNEGDTSSARSCPSSTSAPPPRYTEAALIRASRRTASPPRALTPRSWRTVVNRGYVERAERKLVRRKMMLITDLLTAHFGDVVTVGFTAEMESELDQVATSSSVGADAAQFTARSRPTSRARRSKCRR